MVEHAKYSPQPSPSKGERIEEQLVEEEEQFDYNPKVIDLRKLEERRLRE